MAARFSIQRMSRREKAVVSALAALVCLLVLSEFVVSPLLSRKDALEAGIRAKEKGLVDLRLLAQDYQKAQARMAAAQQRFQNRERGFRLFSFLDRLAGQSGVKKHVEYMNPSTQPIENSPYKVSMVELKLSGITTEQLLAYLYGIESSPNQVRIRRLAITEKLGGERRLVNAVILAVTLET
ncbi:MAG: type II secretion system protein M [Deltaproteobacteria bacterium]|nr:type II secretion system protein M [Deltaproteobacteria bacterium]